MSPERNGEYVTRAELNAHLQPIRDDVLEIKHEQRDMRVEVKTQLDEISTQVGAAPRWLGDRMTKIVDTVLPYALIAATVWLFAAKVAGE